MNCMSAFIKIITIVIVRISHTLIFICFSMFIQIYFVNKLTAQVLYPPVFSHSGGFYNTDFPLILTSSNTNDTIFYTLDGSEPDRSSFIYANPLNIDSRAGVPNELCVIPSNYVLSGNWAYVLPAQEVFKATVVKAKCFSDIAAPSQTVTNTYFVDTLIMQRYNLPVISLSTNVENFFSDSIGIYVPGLNYTGSNNSGNYFETGTLWERPVFWEYFNKHGIKIFEQDARARIHGGDTRLLPQKALRLYADNNFGHFFFSDKNINTFKTLVLRNSGNDNVSTMFRDVFMSSLVRDMGSQLEYQAGFPVVLFINGEFWGIHNLRERIDKYFIGSNANVNPQNIDYLEKHGLVKEGDNVHYFQWYNYLETVDMTQPSSYHYMKTMIDMDNFMNYNIAQLYFSNIDWPSNNRDFWRPRTSDGIWRWIPYDTDFGFGLETYSHFDNNTLVFATTPNGPTTPPSWPTNHPYATLQLRKMLQNEKFRNDFINRFADMLNTTFSEDYVLNTINMFEMLYSQSMPEHIERWSKPDTYAQWQQNVAHLRDFAQNRPTYLRKFIMDYFNEIENIAQDINDTLRITVNVTDTLKGHLFLSTIRPKTYPFTGVYFNNVPIPIKAIPKTGYKFKMWAETANTNPEIFVYLNTDTALTAVFEIDTLYVPRLLFINEFMASNTSSIHDEFGEYDDWIEIYNPNPDTIDIAGFYITDNFSQPLKHQFVSGTALTKIPPYAYLLLWADDMMAQGPLHLAFKLSGTGEIIALYDNSLTLVDSIIFGAQSNDVSYGRFPDGYNNWRFFNTPTPGASNTVSNIIESDYMHLIYVYPNPTNGIIHTNIHVNTIELINVFGQRIMYAENINSLDITNLQKGIYFFRINNAIVKKIILQ